MQCVIPAAAVAEVLLPLSAFSACVVGVISSIARRPDLLGVRKSCKRGLTVQDTEKIHNVRRMLIGGSVRSMLAGQEFLILTN